MNGLDLEKLKAAMGRGQATDHIDWSHVATLADPGLKTSQLAVSLQRAVMGDFPINGVPEEIVRHLGDLMACLEAAELGIQQLGKRMVAELESQGRHSNGAPIDTEALKAQHPALKDHLRFQEKTNHRPDPSEVKRAL